MESTGIPLERPVFVWTRATLAPNLAYKSVICVYVGQCVCACVSLSLWDLDSKKTSCADCSRAVLVSSCDVLTLSYCVYCYVHVCRSTSTLLYVMYLFVY